MKLATEKTDDPDGKLLIVSRDLCWAVPASGIARTLQDAVDRWIDVMPELNILYKQLNAGCVSTAVAFDPSAMAAPLPRAWQWLDGSVFQSHSELMQRAFNLAPIQTKAPLMYQGMSHEFLGPEDEFCTISEEDDIDLEGEFGIITGYVPLGTDATSASQYIHLLVMINDWSLRAIGLAEMKTGFGWIQGKPTCAMGPVAVTIDELADDWINGRINAVMKVSINGHRFGEVPTTEMTFTFNDLIAHAARTRALCAGTIIGSGTISSRRVREVGCCCIAEQRGLEMIDFGMPRTPFLKFADRVRLEATGRSGGTSIFGAIDQVVMPYKDRQADLNL